MEVGTNGVSYMIVMLCCPGFGPCSFFAYGNEGCLGVKEVMKHDCRCCYEVEHSMCSCISWRWLQVPSIQYTSFRANLYHRLDLCP